MSLFPSLTMSRSWLSCLLATFWLAVVLPRASALRLLESKSLNSCQQNSGFTASLFNVVFTPENRSASINVVGVSTITGNVTAEVEVIAYGYTAVRQTLDPCKLNLDGLCPMNTGQINLDTNFQNISSEVISRIPGVAFGIPDLDGIVKVYITSVNTKTRVACVQAHLSNNKTVYQKAVGWSTAVIAGMGLVASAITSGLGHSNTAAHIAANTLSLFGYFQAQAMIGMAAVDLPPIAQSWTQNFEWSMGIMEVEFMQRIFTWYQRATGGTPATLLSSLSTTSVEIHKRSVDTVHRLFLRAYNDMMKRTNVNESVNAVGSTVILRGMKRVAFRAGIETTNLFMTGLTFYIIFVVIVVLAVLAFKGICEMCVKAGWFKSVKFQDFRNGWRTILKGILIRVTLIGYPQMCVLCLWELTQRDSAAEMVLAISFFLGMTATLSWASLKVIRLAKRSVTMHKNPAYILYSDPATLNKWGFLYVQFRATAYYFVVPILFYTLIKAMFVGLAQNSGIAQAIALVLIEAGLLIAVCILRPWMDKKTNTFNISIAVINLINVVFLLIFSNVFNQPGIVTGVVGVVFFILNAVFALVLLILVLISSLYAIFSKNPDTRYQPMRDDRASFTKSQTQLNTELDALGATARGDPKAPYKTRDLDDDESSYSTTSLGQPLQETKDIPRPSSRANSHRAMSQRDHPHSPVDPSVPLFPSDGSPRHEPPMSYSDGRRQLYAGYNGSTQPGSDLPLLHPNSQTGSPRPRSPDYHQPYPRSGSPPSSNVSNYRQQANRSPWQRGAGYEG